MECGSFFPETADGTKVGKVVILTSNTKDGKQAEEVMDKVKKAGNTTVGKVVFPWK